MTKVEIRHVEGTDRYRCTIGGHTVRFRGTREGAERFFASLTQRCDSRGLLCVTVQDVVVEVRDR